MNIKLNANNSPSFYGTNIKVSFFFREFVNMENNNDDELREAFDLFDTNGDGRVPNFIYALHFIFIKL